MDTWQRTCRHEILVFGVVALEFGNLAELLLAQYAATVGDVTAVPSEARHHPIVHADIEIGHQKYRSLKAFREVERLRGELEAFSRIRRKQQNMFGIAMGGVGSFHQIALLSARRHAVEEPTRCTSTITAGISAWYAKPKSSFISEMPGPEVEVKARAPFQDAPITMPMAPSLFGLNDAKVVVSGLRILTIFLAEFLEGIHAGC